MKSGWDNITLEEFTKIRGILRDSGRNEEDKMVAMAAVLQGVSEDTILDMPLEDVAPVFQMVRELDGMPRRGKIRKHYQVGRWSLKVADGKEINVAQWIDFQNYYREDMEEHLADILSVALVPVGKKYNEGYDIEDLKADLWKMSIPDALAVCFFFQRRWLRSMRRTLNYWAGLMWIKGQKEMRRRAVKYSREVSAILRSL